MRSHLWSADIALQDGWRVTQLLQQKLGKGCYRRRHGRTARVDELQARSCARSAIGRQHAYQFSLLEQGLNHQLRQQCNAQTSDTSLHQHSHVVDRQPALDRYFLTATWAVQAPRVATIAI